jgi:L-aspartate oxidase
MSRIVVVGSGVAGLVAALEMSRVHEVTLVTKARLAESNTRYAQGGIAAVMFEDDSVAGHIEDTLQAGAGLCDREAVEVLCKEGPSRIRDLIAIGVAFDQKNGRFARGLEGAHSYPRVLHAGGDATGLAIETAVIHAVREAPITVLEHTFACDLIVQNGRAAGLQVLDETGTLRILTGDAIVLASGGAGNLYPYTTNPSVATGDGVALAFRAGALLADVEFYQFHPTALAAPGNFLISEAVRGAGAVLRAEDGTRFMQKLHPLAELAPRDVVARGIAQQMTAQGGRPVMLDATALGADYLAERFPTIDAACRRLGLDWSQRPVPVTPAAHYWMGGVRTDLEGRTSIPGLFAVGEVACTGVHGANRLASNSLLESVVFAWRVAALLCGIEALDCLRVPEFSGSALSIQRTEGIVPVTRKELQQVMWESAGIYRNEDGLRQGIAELQRWRVAGDSVEARETANMLLLAKAVLAAALQRRESRGAHYRHDLPAASTALQHHILLKQPLLCRTEEAA